MDVINRPALERKLARLLGRGLRDELDELMDYLGDPPRLANVPNEYWQEGWRDIQQVVEPVLMDTFLGQAQAFMDDIGIGVDWDMINQAAASWARTHLEDTLRQMYGRRYDHLNEVIPRFYEEGWSLGRLREDLERWYSPVRADMIATTETTRAAVEGERAVIDRLLSESGIRMIPIWQTSNDEIVCPICGPKHGKPITDGEYPPQHPRCRCFVTHRFAEVQP